MAHVSNQSPVPVIIGGFSLVLILCVGAYFVFGPGAEPKPAPVTAGSYPGDPVKGEPVKTPSGLAYYDLVVGTGATPLRTSRVKVHYTGWLTNGTKFDSSVDSNKPFTFSLSGGVIDGWLEGVATMKVGGKRKLIVPPALGYGAGGSPPKIPGNATLVFDVELLDIVR